jgi:hypothetical protein
MIVRRKQFGPVATALCLVLALAGVARVAHAGSVTSSVLGMFPKDVSEVGYADLKTARQATWFAQFEGQVLPTRFSHFERFLTSAGIDANKQVDEVIWAVSSPSPPPSSGGAASTGDAAAQLQKFSGEQVVGIALGSFSPDVVDSFFTKQKLPTATVRGYTLYAFGSGVSPGDLFFFFLDSNTVAFGHRELLETMIGVHFGDVDSFLSNDTLYSLVNEVNGQGTLWAALDKKYAQLSIGRLMPEAAQFPGAADLLARVKSMTVTIQMDTGLDAQVTPQCASTGDAMTLAQLLQAGLLFKRYQAATANPDVARAIDATSISADGDNLKIRTQLSDDLLQTLLQRNAFTLQM